MTPIYFPTNMYEMPAESPALCWRSAVGSGLREKHAVWSSILGGPLGNVSLSLLLSAMEFKGQLKGYETNP